MQIWIPWRRVWLHPRLAVRDAIEVRSPVIWLAPLAAGIVQSMLQAANNQLGTRAPLAMILGGTALVGSVWGVAQLHLFAAILLLALKVTSSQVPTYARLRATLAIACAPTAAALVGWLLLSLIIGGGLYSDPSALVAMLGPGTGVQLLLLYFGTVACFVWAAAVQVIGLSELLQVSFLRALGTYVGALLCGGLALGIAIAVIAVLVIR